MKKVLVSLFCLCLISVSCLTTEQEKSTNSNQVITESDSLAMAVGKLIAVDCYLSNLADYSDQINKAIDDVFSGQINKLYQAYEYVNASDIVSKSYSKLDSDMNPELIKKVANEIIERAKDSITNIELKTMEREANEYIITYFEKKFDEETEKFLSDVDKMEGVQKTENGIRYNIIKKGEGTISSTDEVDVNYTLYNYNGKVIDSNETSNKPFHVTLPSGVVPGFAQAIQLVGVGGKVKVWIPAELGYGDEGASPSVAPGQVLVFVIEVLKKY